MTAQPSPASSVVGNQKVTSSKSFSLQWEGGTLYTRPLWSAQLKVPVIGVGLHLGCRCTCCDPAKGQNLQNTVPLHGCQKSWPEIHGGWSPPTQWTCSLWCVWSSPWPWYLLNSACQNSTEESLQAGGTGYRQWTHGDPHGGPDPLPGHGLGNASLGSGLLGTAPRETREPDSEVAHAVPQVPRAWGRETQVPQDPQLAGLEEEETQRRLQHRRRPHPAWLCKEAHLGSMGCLAISLTTCPLA